MNIHLKRHHWVKFALSGISEHLHEGNLVTEGRCTSAIRNFVDLLVLNVLALFFIKEAEPLPVFTIS